MTAIFMARMPDGIIAAADAAFYKRDGTLSHIGSKLILMPEQDCIITLQGPYFYHPELRARLSGNAGFDAVLSRAVDAVAEAYLAHDNPHGYSRAFSLLIGGFSAERQAWETYWLHSEPWQEDSEHPSYEAWTLVPAMATAWTPPYGREACLAAGMDPDRGLREQGMAPDEIAVRIICAARAQPIPIHDDPANGTCQVGGFVQFARLGQGWAFTEVRHRWPEMVGERLDPARSVLAPK